MKQTKPILLVMLMLLTACEKTGSDSLCTLDKAIYISKDDKLTGDTARQILHHNTLGKQLCGWGK